MQGARSKAILMWHYYFLFTYQLWTGHKEIGPTVMYVIYVMYATQSNATPPVMHDYPFPCGRDVHASRGQM